MSVLRVCCQCRCLPVCQEEGAWFCNQPSLLKLFNEPRADGVTQLEELGIDDIVGKGLTGFSATVVAGPDGTPIAMVAAQRTGKGGWSKVKCTPIMVRGFLPPRPGARLQKHYPANGKERWQLTYPNKPPQQQSKSATGVGSLDRVVEWGRTCHEAYLNSLDA